MCKERTFQVTMLVLWETKLLHELTVDTYIQNLIQQSQVNFLLVGVLTGERRLG